MAGKPGRQRRMAETVQFIADYTRQYGEPPTRAEVAEHFSVALGTTYSDLQALKAAGRITWDDNRPRSLRVT